MLEKKRRGLRKLIPEEEAEIFNLIRTRLPWQCGCKSSYRDAKPSLWTRERVMQLIDTRCSIKLSDGGVSNHLKRWGFPVLDRERYGYDGCAKVIRNWLDAYHSGIQDRASNEDAKIFWFGKLPMNDPEPGISAQRHSSMVFITTNQNKIYWQTIKGQFNPERQVKFLELLTKEFREKIFLIRDSLDYFTSPLVKTWVKEHGEKIEIFPPAEWKPEGENL